MNSTIVLPVSRLLTLLFLNMLLGPAAFGQALINIDFGGGSVSGKTGFAATGQSTNDFWNLYRHYEPRFIPGMSLVANGQLTELKYADGSPSPIAVSVTNAPGVWGNATGDPMFDSYIFAPDGSNIVVTLKSLESGRYHFYLYGYAAADIGPEQSPVFSLLSGTNRFEAQAASGASGWTAGQPWRERVQYVVFRDVPVIAGRQVQVDIVAGTGGIAVLNGLQILSRGTSPPRLVPAEKRPTYTSSTNILFHEIRYDGKIEGEQIRFAVSVQAESKSTNDIRALLFEGDLAILSPKLPPEWRIVKDGNRFFLHAAKPGSHRLEMQLTPKPEHAEPWRLISFAGPEAAIATAQIQKSASDVDLQFLSGTSLSRQPGKSDVFQGVLGADRRLSLRWQSKAVEVERDAVVTVNSKYAAVISPAAIRYTSHFHYEVLQSKLKQLKLLLPKEQMLTQLTGETVRDWQLEATNEGSLLTIHLLRPAENSVNLTLVTEQALTSLPAGIDIHLPGPMGVQRENGAVTLNSEEVSARIENVAGLRQVNALQGELAAYRFNARTISLRVHLSPVEPQLSLAAMVAARLEETRLSVRHELDITVARAGIYALSFAVPTGLVVSDVSCEGMDDWSLAEGQLSVSFKQRVLGDRKLTVQLEQTWASIPPEASLEPLRLVGASKQTAFVGAGSTRGIQIKTAQLNGAREVPVQAFPNRKDELLAYRADTANWRITLAVERSNPRVVAEVFNLVTVGDGLVGGSAVIRYGIVNQGLQQFRVRLPKHWRNVEFTGPSIRRKDVQEDIWTIALQDKVWGGYTLVITYDHPFDPRKAALDAAGAHPLDVERETGTVAITSAPSLSVEPGPIAEPLRQIDPTEIPETDRSLISRPVRFAYRYEGNNFGLTLNLTRHDELSVLDAVSDRVQMTTVLTDNSEMLTQAGFMVKNNERQFQRFKLPAGAVLWGVTVNGEPVKAERDGDWLLISLPRGADRDQVFAVDLKYAQKVPALGRIIPGKVHLVAPQTDVPGTYAEWELYVPASKRASQFAGNMTVARGTTYSFRSAWQEFVHVYKGLWHNYGAGVIFFGGIGGFIVALGIYGRRKGFQGFASVIAVFCVLAILAGMLLPALSKAKAKAQRIKSVNNLKNIGLAARLFATEHEGRMPGSFEEMMTELSTDKILFDPETGERYTYVGAGKSEDSPNGILAYSSEKNGQREVVLTDGSVQVMNARRFAEALAKDTPAGQAMEPALARRYSMSATGPAASEPPPAAQQSQVIAGVTAGAADAPKDFLAGVANQPAAMAPAGPTAAGIKSLRIEIPKSGRAYHFTRVLNLGGESATIQLSLMSAKVFTILRSAYQLAAFLLGLIIIWRQWRRLQPSSFWLAIGIGLAFLGTLDLFVAWRMLHLVLIATVPGITVIVVGWILWKFLRSAVPQTADASAEPPPLNPGVTATTLLVFGLFLSANASGQDMKSANAVSVVSASYQGFAQEEAASLDATLEFQTLTTNQTLKLFGNEMAVQEFNSVSGEARIVREGEFIHVSLPQSGNTVVRMKLLVKVGGDMARRTLSFGVPAALSSRLSLTVNEPNVEIESPEAISLARVAKEDRTEVEALLGASDRVTLSWMPRGKKGGEATATAFSSQASLVSFGNGVLHVRTVIDWQVSQGEVRSLHVALPTGHRLLKIDGDQVRQWDYSDTNKTAIHISLTKPVSSSVRVAIETEQTLDQLPAEWSVALPRPLDVKRAGGILALQSNDELEVSIQRSAGLDRFERTEFLQLYGKKDLQVESSWRFIRPEFNLVVRAEPLKPRIEVAVRNHFTVGNEQLGLLTSFDYSISRIGVFVLRVVVPSDARLDKVECAAMQSWAEQNEGGVRVLEIRLKERTIGSVHATVQTVQTFAQLPPEILLEGVHPLQADKLTGFVSASAEPGVGLKTLSVTGLSEIPAASLPGGQQSAGMLSFKYLTAGAPSSSPWKLVLSIERLESWLRADVASFITVGETLISGRATIRYEIQNAPVKEFQLSVPSDWRNVEIYGAGIRRRDQTAGQGTNVWRIELQGKMFNEYRLSIHWEEPRPGTNSLDLSGLQTLGVEREIGTLAFHVSGQLQITPQKTSDQLLRIDARELPEWATDRPSGVPVISYRYLRPGWKLGLGVQRFQDAALLQALVDNVRLRTVVADDGQFMTHMDVVVRNNGRQSLALVLPDRSKVWSAFVDGQPVRPAQKDNRLLLPLDRSGAEDAPITVEITYVGDGIFPRKGGKVELASPRLDVPLKEARWEVFLPPDYSYDQFKGTMAYESAELVPIAQDFTLAEYRRQEVAKLESFQSQAVELLKKTKSEVASGRYDNAAKLQLFRSQALRDIPANKELEDLERNINRVQSSNLIQAQQSYVSENAVRLGIEGLRREEQEGRQVLTELDVKVAEQQVLQLQKAQAVAVSRVTPLRVNLPTRGLRHSFVQVLQTEVDKPLVIWFKAENDREVGWFKMLLMGVGIFLVLWIAAWVIANIRVNHRTEAA